MKSLATTIRAIRKRRGETVYEFGSRLGVNPSTISKYELGKAAPSRSLLLLLYPLAEGEERRSIVAALGQVPEEIQVLKHQLERDVAIAKAEMDQVLREMKEHPDTRRRMLGLALKIGRDPEIPLWIPNLLSFWNRHKHEVRLRDFTNQLMTDVMEKLYWEETREELGGPELSDRPTKKDLPLRVMIRCPQTGEPVFTGAEVTAAEFEQTDFTNMRVSCPHCLATHMWSKSDAFLDAA